MNAQFALFPSALLLSACAQQLPASEAPAAARTAPAPAAAPRVVTLPGAICDRNRTAGTIMRVQLAADRLIARVKADPAFGGAWFEHSPCYRIVLGFTHGLARQWVVDAAEPDLRPYIAFARTQFSLTEREQARPQIMAAIADAGAQTSVFFSSVNPEQFTVGVPTEADAHIAKAAIPERYRDITRVEVGDFRRIPERESSTNADVLRQPPLTMNQVAEFQLHVVPLGQAVRQMPGFSDLYIEHEPTWHVVVSFTEPVPPHDKIAALAATSIRDRIIVRTAKRTKAEVSADLDRLASALRAVGLTWGGGYDVKTQRFEVMVTSHRHVEKIRAAIPDDLRDETDVVVRDLPVPE